MVSDTLILWVAENFVNSLSTFLLFFFGDKKSYLWLSWPVLLSLDHWILLICLAVVQNQGNIHPKTIPYVSRGARGGVFLVETGRYGF